MSDTIDYEELLLHYGTPRHSGRYPYGSGKDPQRNKSFLTIKDEAKEYLKSKGLDYSETAIAQHLGLTTSQLRDKTTIANEERKQALYKEVKTRLDRGESIQDIAVATDISVSSVRNYAKMESSTVNTKRQTSEIADVLKDSVDSTGFLDVGTGVETQIGISEARMKASIAKLKEEGYYVHNIRVEQVANSNQYTTTKVLTKEPDIKEVYKNLDKVKSIEKYAEDGDGSMIQELRTPKSIDWDRVKIRYAIPEGQPGHGTEKDGETMDGSMIIRPGTKDLNLGAGKHYAQVRIAVGGSHYLKGVALYGEEKDFPKGVDVIFNTNKTKDKSPREVLKPLKDDLTGANPFGATLKRQNHMLDSNGNYVQAKDKNGKPLFDKKGKPVKDNGAVNIVNEEGDWMKWGKSMSSQFLSKQPVSVIKERLNATLKKTDADLEEIMKVNNPVIRKQLLESYASGLESKQVHLKATAPKGFQSHLILPVPKMKETEVFAPNYKDGDKVILVRYPHGGTFEIPELTVNNKGPGRKIVGKDSPDAIGIHPKVAGKLSGADFDGDTVYVIPNNSKKYKSSPALKELKGFEPKAYQDTPGTFKPMSKALKGQEMGKISNLITDMTMQGASPSELARAVKHSMVVIDAEKHKLNYKRSADENGIKALKDKYQHHIDRVDYSQLKGVDMKTGKKIRAIDPNELKTYNGKKESAGAGTIISQHKRTVTTGGQVVEVPNPTKKNPTGTKYIVRNRQKSYVIPLLKDARVLLTPKSSKAEVEYADYVNQLKSRKAKVDKLIKETPGHKRNPEAAKQYAVEVASLKNKLDKSILNRPKERRAQILARLNYEKEIERQGGKDNMGADDIKRLKNQALIGARARIGASRTPVQITDSEWHAIQKGAISAHMLQQLVRNMNDDQLKELATPREKKRVTTAQQNRALAMLRRGYTISQVAQAVGISTSAINTMKNDTGIEIDRSLTHALHDGLADDAMLHGDEQDGLVLDMHEAVMQANLDEEED